MNTNLHGMIRAIRPSARSIETDKRGNKSPTVCVVSVVGVSVPKMAPKCFKERECSSGSVRGSPPGESIPVQ